MKQYPVGSVHGRFQVFHNDHLDYILKALDYCEHLIIGITSFNIRSLMFTDKAPHRSVIENNPLTYFERTELIKLVLVAEGINAIRFSFTPFPIEEPELLSDFVPNYIPCLTTIRETWNSSKIELLKQLGYTVVVLKEDYNKEIEGSDIRKKILLGDETWKQIVPKITVDYVERNNILQRMQR